VKNLGTVSAGAAGSYVGFYLSSNTTLDGSDIALGDDFVGNLGAGNTSGIKSGSLTIPGGTAAGTYYILFVADEDGTVAESDETNNVKARQIAVTSSSGQPDLTPINIVMGSTSVAAGSGLAVSCKVKNIGTASAGAAGSYVGFYLSSNTTLDGGDIALGSEFVGNIGAGVTSGIKSATLTIPGGTASGTYYILFAADEFGTVSESDEANNVKDRQISVTSTGGPQPDLTPINIVMGSTSVSAGSSMTVSCKIKNLGAGSASPSSVGFYLSSDATLDGGDTKLDGAAVGGIAAGATSGTHSGSLTIPGGTASGTYYILFAADEFGTVSESDEGNNVKDRQLTVTSSAGQSDLLPINIVISSTSVSAGSSVNVDCKIRNIGTAPSGSVSYVGYYLSTNTTLDGGDMLLGSVGVGSLNPLTSSGAKPRSLTIPAITSNGTYYILYVADYDSDVSESDEANNVKNRQITVTGNPIIGPSKLEIVADGVFDIKQFPNPTQGELFVEFTSLVNSNENVELNIFDASGRLVLGTEFNEVQQGSKYELDVSQFTLGIYNVVYTSKDNVVTKKLIITN
jgi:subtilase family serine protease